MNFRSLALGAVVFGLLAPAAFAGQSNPHSCVFESKSYRGNGLACETMGQAVDDMSYVQGFKAPVAGTKSLNDFIEADTRGNSQY